MIRINRLLLLILIIIPIKTFTFFLLHSFLHVFLFILSWVVFYWFVYVLNAHYTKIIIEGDKFIFSSFLRKIEISVKTFEGAYLEDIAFRAIRINADDRSFLIKIRRKTEAGLYKIILMSKNTNKDELVSHVKDHFITWM